MRSAKCYWEGRDVFMKIFKTLCQFLSVPKFKILGELFTVTLNHHQMQLKSVFKVMILFMLKNKKNMYQSTKLVSMQNGSGEI